MPGRYKATGIAIIFILVVAGIAVYNLWPGIVPWSKDLTATTNIAPPKPADKIDSKVKVDATGSTSTVKVICDKQEFVADGKGPTNSSALINIPDGCLSPEGRQKVDKADAKSDEAIVIANGAAKLVGRTKDAVGELEKKVDAVVVKLESIKSPSAAPTSPTSASLSPASVDMSRYYTAAQKCGINRTVALEDRPRWGDWFNKMSRAEFDAYLATCGREVSRRPAPVAPASRSAAGCPAGTRWVNDFQDCFPML